MLRTCARALALTLLLPAAVNAELLGRIDFPNSGSEAAQADFLEGVLYLHNFEYEDARDAFRRARETDGDFVLAYWGEAMTHNHPIWMEQETQAGRAVLEALGATPRERRERTTTEREGRYVEAVEILFGLDPKSADADKATRDDLYLAAMSRLAADYPDDHEARAFEALAVLGSAHEGRDFATYMRAAAIAFDVWNANDQHPGAAHYLIHSFDDPVHAPLGVPMAETYAEIAPAAAHAQHMTSHIFVALGRWQDVIDANIVARDVQNAGFEKKDRPPRLCGHYPYWLLYGYLQLGRAAEAQQVMDACRGSVDMTTDEGVQWHYAAMWARQAIDLEDWEAEDDWPEDLDRTVGGHHNYVFARGLAAYYQGEDDAVRQALGMLRAVENGEGARRDDFEDQAQILALELEALLAVDSDPEAAVAKLAEAVELETARPYMFGPPTIMKPSLELLGEVLLTLGRNAEAADAFSRQLARTPGRALSLLGAGRAARALEDWDAAGRSYGELRDLWSGADEKLPLANVIRTEAALR